jgi:hypothetical protein
MKLETTDSNEYLDQLYCGTVARGVTYLNGKTQALDSNGSQQGLAEIVRVCNSNKNHRPLLNKYELQWIVDQRDAMWSSLKLQNDWRVRFDFYEMDKHLEYRNNDFNRRVSIVSLLVDAKRKRRMLDIEEKRQSIAFIQSKLKFSDPACKGLLQDLLKSVESRSFIIPDYKYEWEIKAARNQGIEYFSVKMENRKVTVLGYYAYAQISQFLANGSPESFRRAKIALRMLAKELSPSFLAGRTEKEEAAGPRIVIGVILKKAFPIAEMTDGILKFTISELRKIQEVITSSSPALPFGSKKFKILEIIAAYLLGIDHPELKTTLTDLVADPDWKILCPDMESVIQRLQKPFDVTAVKAIEPQPVAQEVPGLEEEIDITYSNEEVTATDDTV